MIILTLILTYIFYLCCIIILYGNCTEKKIGFFLLIYLTFLYILHLYYNIPFKEQLL